MAKFGETARVRLLPAGLGAVQITVSATGMATVQADNPRVLSALREMPGQIAAILEQAGVPVRAGAISFGAMGRTAVQARDVPAAVTGDTADVPGEPVRAVKPQADPRPVSGRAPPDPVALARVEPALSAPEARPPADPLPQRPTEPAIAPQGSRPHEHLASHVTGQLKGQRVAEGTTRIALSPQGLGTLEIELARDDAGALRVVVRAENPAVLGALRDNREGLLGVLRDSGHGVQDSGLGFEAFGREGRPQHRAEPGGTGFVEAEEDEPEAAVIPVALADGRIDIIT